MEANEYAGRRVSFNSGYDVFTGIVISISDTELLTIRRDSGFTDHRYPKNVEIINPVSKKDLSYLKMAILTAESSKCLKAKYGSIIVSKDDRVISTGRNGKPRGSINDDICFRMGEERDDSHSCCVHSERNCIMFANPIEREGGTIYVSGIPCKDCALAIMNSGLARGVFLLESHSVTGLRVSTEEFWNLYGSKVERVYVTRGELG